VEAAEQSSATFRELCLADGRGELRAYYPNDICNILNSIARYENREPAATKEHLKRGVRLYFTGV
jgi:hypothetical protein